MVAIVFGIYSIASGIHVGPLPLMARALGVMAKEVLKALDEGEDYDGAAPEVIQLAAV